MKKRIFHGQRATDDVDLMSMKYVIGIDEVGRGPVAGPLVVCACALAEGVEVLWLFPKGQLRDSKK